METMITMSMATPTRKRHTGRLAKVRAINKKKGWRPMTTEEKKAFDEAIRMVTHLD